MRPAFVVGRLFLCENTVEVMRMQGNPYQAYQPVYGNPYGMRQMQQYYQPQQPQQIMEQAAVVMVSDRREVDSQIVNDLAPHFFANRNGMEIYVKQVDSNTGSSFVRTYTLAKPQQQEAPAYVTADEFHALEGKVNELSDMIKGDDYQPRRAGRRAIADDAE